MIVSNPPYIKYFAINDLDSDIKNYEPKVALNGGIDGYSKIRLTIKKSSTLIKERELDLVLVSEKATPPVCRIMNYGKFKFEQEKKQRKLRKNHIKQKLKK